MPIALLDDLRTLDDALGDGTDLAAHLGHLVRVLVEAVPTLVAVAITVTIDGYPLTVGATPDPGTARTSIAVAMPTGTTGEVSSQLVAYATDPAAFTNVRMDAIHGLSIHPDAVTVDAHLDGSTQSTTLADFSIINQAVGILVDRGQTPDDARTSLHRNASTQGRSPLAYARALIAEAARAGPIDEKE